MSRGPREIVPQDVLEAMRKNDDELKTLLRVIELQEELIETQRETINFQRNSIKTLKEIVDIKDIFIEKLGEKFNV